jgi:hypothetical protein
MIHHLHGKGKVAEMYWAYMEARAEALVSLIAGGLSTPFGDASAGVMVLFAVVHLDWLDGAA